MFPRIDQRMSQPGEVNLKEKQGYVQLHRNHLPVVQSWGGGGGEVSVSKSCLSLPLCGQGFEPKYPALAGRFLTTELPASQVRCRLQRCLGRQVC